MSPPLTGGASSQSSIVLHEDGRLIVDSTNPTQHVERRLSPMELAAVHDYLKSHRDALLGPRPPEPRAFDISGSCEVWIDGQHRTFEIGSSACSGLQGVVPSR